MKFGRYEGKVESNDIVDAQYSFRFDNGYGASIIQGGIAYTTAPYWELAVTVWEGNDFRLDYDTPITNDVIAPLTEAGVVEILEKIEKL